MATLVQYIVVRGDLASWPTGALIAQACHASTAVMYLFKDDPIVQAYFSELDSMHKVVLKAEDQPSLEKLATALQENSVDHKLWIEQPENIPTCVAVKPYPKNDIQKYFKKFKLFK